jgi:hypothetical protein
MRKVLSGVPDSQDRTRHKRDLSLHHQIATGRPAPQIHPDAQSQHSASFDHPDTPNAARADGFLSTGLHHDWKRQ